MKNKYILPNLFIIFILSHFFYYFPLMENTKYNGTFLVYFSLFSAFIGFVFAKHLAFRINNYESNFTYKYDFKKVERYGKIIILIGVFAHIIYYGVINTGISDGYADSYLVSTGYGFITAFFDFIIVGYIIISALNFKNKASKGGVLFANVVAIMYSIFYTFFLLKRRQVLFLLIAFVIFHFKSISKKNKIRVYFFVAIIYILFLIFGRIRSYTNVYGFDGVINYIFLNFDLSWLSITSSEGQYISRTHSEVFEYIGGNNFTFMPLLGSLITLVPRKLLSFSKPLSFPSWYAKTFYPDMFLIGAGFSGSFIIEQYLYGGILAVALVYFLVGFTIRRFNTNLSSTRKLEYLFIYPVVVYLVVFLPRFDWGSIIIILIFNLSPLIIILKLSRRKIYVQNH